MAAKKNIIALGFLTIIIATGVLFAILANKVALEVKCESSTFYVNISGTLEKAGIEKVLLYDQKNKQIARSSCVVYAERRDGFTYFFKNSTYPGGTTVVEKYSIDERNPDIIFFPADHVIEIRNGTGKQLRYVASSLVYSGPTIHHVTTPQRFGRDMQVAWADHYDITDAWIVKNAGGKGTLNINYNVSWEFMKYSMRLFDPPSVEFNATFCSSAHGFTGGQNVSCLYNTTGTSSQIYSTYARTCSDCNISFMLKASNLSFGTANIYYACNLNSIANEAYILENYNATHGQIKPAPGYDFSNGYIPYNEWVQVTIVLSDTSALSTIYVYNSDGVLFNTFIYGSRLQKSYTTSGKYLCIDTAGSFPFAITNVTITDLLGTGGGGGSGSSGAVDITGAINFSLISPLNLSNTTGSSVNASFQVWNLNVTSSGGSPGWSTVYDINMTTNPCTNGWTCGTGWAWDSASGKLFYNGTGNTGNLHSGDLDLASLEAYNVSLNMSTQNTTNTKIHYMTDNGELDNCKFAPRRTSDTQHDIQRDCGSFSNTAAWNNGVEARIDIFVNVTGNLTVACRTASGSTSCTSSAGAELTDLGDYFGIDDPQTCVGCSGSWLNITRFTVTAYTSGSVAGNSTLNVSVYNGSGSLLYEVNGTANASIVSFNWTGLSAGLNAWYVTIRNAAGNVLNVTPLYVNSTQTASFTPGNLTVSLINPVSSVSVERNANFPFTAQICCVGNGTCGAVSAYLDPAPAACNTVLCANETYTGSGTLNGKTWAQIESILQAPLLNSPNGWVIYQVFNSGGKALLWNPWHTFDNDAAEADLKDAYVGGLATFTLNTAVTDESSEWWTATVLNLTFTQIMQFTNTLDACVDTNPSHNSKLVGYLTSWICSHNGATITKNDQNSAADATARIALGYWMCALDPTKTASEREFCKGRAENITSQSITEEWVNTCQPSPINGTVNLCFWHLAGAAQAWGGGALTQVGEQMFIGYHESDIANYLAACAQTGNMTYCDYARYETHQFLYVMGDDGVGNSSSDFKMNVCNKHYYMVCPGGGAPCTTTCSGSAGGFEDADATRAWMTCRNVRYAELTYDTLGLPLPWEFQRLKSFCQAWSTRVENSGTVTAGGTQLVDADNGCVQIATGGTCKSTHGVNRYREQGWVAFMIGDKSFLNSFLVGPLRYFNVTKQYYDKVPTDSNFAGVGGNPNPTTPAYGIYGQVGMLKLIRDKTGYFDFLYVNQTFDYASWANGTAGYGNFSNVTPTEPSHNKSGTLVSTIIGDLPFYTLNDNPNTTASGLSSMLNGTCVNVTWNVNATGDLGSTYEFYAFANSSTSEQANSSRINITISGPDTAPPVQGAVVVVVSNSSANITYSTNEQSTTVLCYGTTVNLGTCLTNGTLTTSHVFLLSGLLDGTVYYFNRTDTDFSGNAITTGPFNFTTNDTTRPTVTLIAPANASNQTSSTVSFSWNVTDNVNASLACYLYLNSTGTWRINATTNVSPGSTGELSVSGFVNGSSYKWNVQCNDSSANNAFAAQNYTFSSTLVSSTVDLLLCANMTQLVFDPSKANLNTTTGRLTQYNMTPRGHAPCSCDLYLNNTGSVAQNVSLSTNISNTTRYVFKVNAFNVPKNFTVSPAAPTCLNVTMDYVQATAGVPPFVVRATAVS